MRFPFMKKMAMTREARVPATVMNKLMMMMEMILAKTEIPAAPALWAHAS